MKKLSFSRKVNLATLLSAFVTASVIATLLFLAISNYYFNKEHLKSIYLSLNYSKAEEISEDLDSLFISMRTNLDSTGDFLEKHEGMSNQEIDEYLALLRKSSEYFNSLSWVDETGLVRASSPVSVEGEITAGVINDILDAEKPMLTTAYIESSNRLSILMSQPIYSNDGTYRGIISGSINPQQQNILNRVLRSNAIEESGSYYFVVDSKGILLFHPEHHLIGKNLYKNPIVRKVTEGKSGMESISNTKEISMLSSYSYVPEVGWGIVQQTPYSYVQDLLLDQLRQAVMKMLVPFLLLLFLSIFIARKLAEPFIRLGNHSKWIAEGKPIPQPFKELLMKHHWNQEADFLIKNVGMAFEILERNNQQLIHSSLTDPLTGLANRRKLDEILNAWTSEGRLFSLLMLDIDHFKSINDTYGHLKGDEALKKLAETIQNALPDPGDCFRYGGEEFVILLTETDALKAYNLAEKIRGNIERMNLIPERTITVSIGLAEFPTHANSLHELFRLADEALYESKLEGRNRSTVSFTALAD